MSVRLDKLLKGASFQSVVKDVVDEQSDYPTIDVESTDPIVSSFRDLLKGHGYEDEDTMNLGYEDSHFHKYKHRDKGYEFKWAHGMRRPYWFVGNKDDFLISGHDFDEARETLRQLHKERKRWK